MSAARRHRGSSRSRGAAGRRGRGEGAVEGAGAEGPPYLGPITDQALKHQPEGPPPMIREWHDAMKGRGDYVLLWAGAMRPHGETGDRSRSCQWVNIGYPPQDEDGQPLMTSSTDPARTRCDCTSLRRRTLVPADESSTSSYRARSSNTTSMSSQALASPMGRWSGSSQTSRSRATSW